MLDERVILLSEDVLAEPERVKSTLSKRVREIVGQHRQEGLHVFRLAVKVERRDPFSWLQAQDIFPRIYWNGRDDEVVTAAVGSADLCYGGPGSSYRDLRSQLDVVLPNSDNRVRYFGGFRFDREAHRSPEWESFGTFTFVLPRFEYVLKGSHAVLACNLLLPQDADRLSEILAQIDSLDFPETEINGELPLPVSRHDGPDSLGWTRNIEWALKQFHEGSLQKIVLARRAEFEFAEALDSVAILKKLERVTANCFRYGFQFEPGAAFIGATPERLFRRSGRRVWTEAVAGTRRRGTTAEEDARLLNELMSSDKDQREHAFVRESIRESLAPLCDSFYIDPDAAGMQLPRGWHLVSRSRGTLKIDVHGSDVMRALHPTPAVGGHPTSRAIPAIREIEPFDRGWYAGPVGWVGSRGAEFAVALRCGLVSGRSLSLYSGAGIVEGSNPAEEWNEIEQKISDFIRIFGLD